MSLEQVASFGENATRLTKRGETLPAIENLDRGITILEKLLQHATNFSEKSDLRARLFDFLARKTDLLLVSGGTSAALSTALYMCSTDPRNARAYFAAGQALRKLQKHEQAVEYLTMASKLDPTDSLKVKESLEQAVTELRLPSSVALSSSTSSVGGDGFPTDLDGIVKFAQKYTPSAAALTKYAKEKPAHAAGAALSVLVVLMLFITIEFIMFVLCVGGVVWAHRWEKRRAAQNTSCGSSSCCCCVRLPIVDVPLSVVTSVFLSTAAVYLLLL